MSRRTVCHITFRRMGAVCARKGAEDIIRATLPTEAEWHAWYPSGAFGKG